MPPPGVPPTSSQSLPPAVPPQSVALDTDVASLTAKGFLRSLYDFGFTSFITLRIIRFVYALLVILYSIFAVISLLVGLASGKAPGIFFAIIVVPIVYLLYLILLRIWMEVIVVFFKIGEDVHAIRHRA